MINIALPNNGNLNAASLFSGTGKGTVQSIASGSEDVSKGADTLPFSMIFAKMVKNASPSKEAASSVARQKADQSEDIAAGALTAGEQKTPFFMLKIKDVSSGQENDVVAVELDLQALLQALKNGEIAEEQATDATESEDAATALSSYLAAMISALQNQGVGIESAQAEDVEAGSQGLTPVVMQGGDKRVTSIMDNLLSLGENASTEGADKGNKILLTLPQELLKGFVVNKNGQPQFSMNGLEGTPSVLTSTEGGEVAPAGQPLSVVTNSQDAEGMTFQLVRLNTQAASASPQGTLLAAVIDAQKTNQTTPTAADADSGYADTEGALPVNPFQHETLVKSSGERQFRNMLLNAAPVATDNALPQKGSDPQAGVVSPSAESDVQDPLSAVKGTEILEEAALLGEAKVKSASVLSGKESTQWVPCAGAASPQLAPGTETALKGIFIPMDRVISEAGKVLENGSGKVQMTLQPPSLGTINMEVVVQNNRVDLVLTANHADVQQLLQANADQLKNALNNQGFQIDQMSVLLKRDNPGFNLGGHSLWQEGAGQQQNQGNGSAGSGGTSVPETETILPRRDYGTGTISIFA